MGDTRSQGDTDGPDEGESLILRHKGPPSHQEIVGGNSENIQAISITSRCTSGLST